MHLRMQEHLAAYASYYSLLKKPRALQWRPTLGVTKLNLFFEDGRTIFVSVSPPLANLILHFQEKSLWTLAELATATGSPVGSSDFTSQQFPRTQLYNRSCSNKHTPVETVQKRMVYWSVRSRLRHLVPGSVKTLTV